MTGSAKPASGGNKPAQTDANKPADTGTPTSASTATTASTPPATDTSNGSTPPADDGKAQPGPQASAEGNTEGANPNPQPGGGEDKTKPTDPDFRSSVGADNPNQPAPAQTQGSMSPAADRQGNSSREAEEARRNGLDPAAATVGQGTVAPLPSEGGGFAPIPHPDTGAADSDKVPYTQATQRLVHPDDMHHIPTALGTIANIPPGSRPMMVDPETGRGLVPPQIAEHDEDEGDEDEHDTLRA